MKGFLFVSENVCIQIPYLCVLLLPKLKLCVGTILVCHIHSFIVVPSIALDRKKALNKYLFHIYEWIKQPRNNWHLFFSQTETHLWQWTHLLFDYAHYLLTAFPFTALNSFRMNRLRFPAQQSHWNSQRQPGRALRLLGSKWDRWHFHPSTSSSVNCLLKSDFW